MPVKNETSTRFMDEIRIISPWAFFFATLPYFAAIAAMVYATLSGKPPMPLAEMVAAGVLGGTVLACYILLIGYVNRDAGRRGMNRLAWTLLAIFIPNALGIVLYFVLRTPRIASCPQCGHAVQTGFNFCPRCSHKVSPSCAQCQRVVGVSDVYCPYCGVALRDQAVPATGAANEMKITHSS
jgi:RNA polymerase subunit RPABC4/transcription elongation factor Spt4